MDRERPADETHTGGASAEPPQSIDSGLNDCRIVSQAEIVVRRQNQNLAAALHAHAGSLWRVQVVELLVDFVPLELLDRVGQISCQRHHATSKITLPASPDLMTRMASSTASSGNRCVMTGVGSNWPDRKNRVIWCHVSYMRRPTTP